MKTNLQNIILAETSFKRDRSLKPEDKLKLSTEIEIKHGIVRESFLIVEFIYNAYFYYSKKDKKNNQITYSSKHVAQFELSEFDINNNEDLLSAERFSNVNAAAMIFPFIRENIATISAKAGMASLLIPIANFITLYEEKKEKEKQKEDKAKNPK
ncbi:protein-export chaperone SecB [Chryseobacterium sp.]|uniref:protein-export chaperone SecB n=2 Tax=Chryseobacterium TaxID=59732 RepID=UPI001B0E9B82|nr:protein-export chaperone SecB [Chryseobacterium sp.]MBO9694561.1 protein-export chaperone SecB [Chryseobacterium sp.]